MERTERRNAGAETGKKKAGAAEQERIASEEFDQFSLEAELPSFGRQAVEQAEGQSSLANSDAVVAGPAEVIGKVRDIGSHSFVNVDGKWTDTMFDPNQMDPIKVSFLSDDYFELARIHPTLADAFALGIRVIVVFGDLAYEVVDEQTPVDPIKIPTNQPTQVIDQPEESIVTPIPIEADVNQPKKPVNSTFPCLGGLFAAVFPLLIFGVVRQIAVIDK